MEPHRGAVAQKPDHGRPQRRHARREDRSVERLRWWGCGVDSRRLLALLSNDAERRHAGWPSLSEPNHHQADDLRSPRQSPWITAHTWRSSDGCGWLYVRTRLHGSTRTGTCRGVWL